MDMPDGMYFYEFVLLVLGSLLFIALLVLLIVFAVQKRPLKTLLAFYILPIIMIGFPAYQKISYDDGVVSVEKLTRQVSGNPSDKKAREALETGLSEINERSVEDPKVMLTISEAHAALGDTLKALSVAESALKSDAALPGAKSLIVKFSAPLKRIELQAQEAAKHPADTAERNAILSNLDKLEQSSTVSPSVFVTRAKIHASMGDTAAAIVLADSAVLLDRNYRDASELKQKLRRVR